MKGMRYSEQQIIKILKEAEAGIPVTDLSRQYGFSKSSFYKWKAKYGGMEASGVRLAAPAECETPCRRSDNA